MIRVLESSARFENVSGTRNRPPRLEKLKNKLSCPNKFIHQILVQRHFFSKLFFSSPRADRRIIRIVRAGYYAGYVASAFMFGRLISGYAIGCWSDKVGRKPVIVLSLLSIMIFSVAFGFSKTLSWAIGTRCEIQTRLPSYPQQLLFLKPACDERRCSPANAVVQLWRMLERNPLFACLSTKSKSEIPYQEMPH